MNKFALFIHINIDSTFILRQYSDNLILAKYLKIFFLASAQLKKSKSAGNLCNSQNRGKKLYFVSNVLI